MKQDANDLAVEQSRMVQDWVRCRLKERGETIDQFSERTGISFTQLYQIRSQAKNFSLKTIIRMVTAVGGTVEIHLGKADRDATDCA